MILPNDVLIKSTLPYFSDVEFDSMVDGIDFYQEDLFYPNFGIPGNLSRTEEGEETFIPGVNPSYLLVCTLIPFSFVSTDYFKIEGRIWEHYHEDRHRGYLFQIIPYTDDISSIKFVCY